MRSQTITTLQAGRALAAIAVVFVHINDALPPFGIALPAWIATPSSFGGRGVDFFFVLSGFIIFHAHHNDSLGWRSARLYVSKRITRIYIPYLPVSLALITLYTLLPEISQSDREWSLFTSTTLIPSSAEPALSVGWTLVHEMAFYSIFFVYFFLPGFRFLILLWAMIILALWVGGVDLGHRAGWLRAYFSPINLEFIGGMIAFLAAQRLDAKWWPVLLSVTIFGALVYFTYHNSLHRVFFGASIVPGVISLVLLERKGLRAPRWLVFLGAASYAIYLVHKPVISLAVRISDYASFWPFAFLSCLLLSVAVGAFYHLVFEKRALAFAKKLISKPRDYQSSVLGG